MTIEDIEQQHNFVTSQAPQPEVIIKVVGVGGGGSNAVTHMYNQGVRNISFALCNTDRQALNNSPVPTRLLIGPTTTRGLGAGNKPEVARAAAEESAEEINALFDDNTKMVFITAGMGGGTGTGAAPVVARIAKERGLLTIGIVTIPFLFEGPKKILKALDGADEMSKYVDALLLINNERLTEIYADLDFFNGFAKADDTLSNAATSISDIITSEAHINLDFNDVDTTLRGGGTAIISTGYGEGDDRVAMAIEDALNSPLLKNRDIMGSKHLLFNLYFSRKADKTFKMDEVKSLTNFMAKIGSDVDVIWGTAFDDTLGDRVKISILAAGFEVTVNDRRYAPPSSSKDQNPDATRSAAEVQEQELVRLTQEYGDDKIDEIRRRKDAQNYIILTAEMMDDDAFLERLERTPAYNRDKKVAEELRNYPVGTAAPAQATQASSAPASQPAADNVRPGEINFIS